MQIHEGPAVGCRDEAEGPARRGCIWQGRNPLLPRLARRRFRLYVNEDILGVELAGALKNVVAIAAGAGDTVKPGGLDFSQRRTATLDA